MVPAKTPKVSLLSSSFSQVRLFFLYTSNFQSSKPDILGGYWLSTYGPGLVLASEHIMHDIEEAIGKLPVVLETRAKYKTLSHLKMIKRRALATIDHCNAVEADLSMNAVNEARLKELEDEASLARSNAQAASALADGLKEKLANLEKKLEEKTTEAARLSEELKAEQERLENDWERLEEACGFRAYYYGERILAALSRDFPDAGLDDPQVEVPSENEAVHYASLVDARAIIFVETPFHMILI
ncbi:uncharacterized protein [Euphorbia lathyris]|uniref:uncharacterized protein n=1 Tax=Euphorbia lathyris TaxID=212925 RepID=UPI0033137587